jgi:hypothetical protein
MYFWNRTLHVSDRFSVHHQEYTAIGLCHTGFAGCLLAGSGWNILIPLASSQHNLYVLLCVQCWIPDAGQRNCPKHVEFYSKNKFEKLMHLVGFVIRIYHDTRPAECQMVVLLFFFKSDPSSQPYARVVPMEDASIKILAFPHN